MRSLCTKENNSKIDPNMFIITDPKLVNQAEICINNQQFTSASTIPGFDITKSEEAFNGL